VRVTHVHTDARVSSGFAKLKLVLLYHSYSLPLKELIVTDQQLHEDRFDKFEDPFGHIWYISRQTRRYTYKENMLSLQEYRSALLPYMADRKRSLLLLLLLI
jgi:hypothetical protein